MGAIDPSETYELTPARDMSAEPGHRRVFVFRHLSCREWKKAAALLETLDKSESAVSALDNVVVALQIAMVGWRNVPGTNGYDPEILDSAITNQDAVDLLTKMLAANGLTPDQLKNYESRWASVSALSAPTAMDQQVVETSQQNSPPSSFSAHPAPVVDVAITESAATEAS